MGSPVRNIYEYRTRYSSTIIQIELQGFFLPFHMVYYNRDFHRPSKYPLGVKNWDPEKLNSVRRKTISNLEPVLSYPIITFAQTKKSDVIINPDPEGKVDDFTDEDFCIGLYENNNWFKLASCVPLIIYTMDHHVSKSKPISYQNS